MPIPAAAINPINVCPASGTLYWWGVGDSITAGPLTLGGWRSLLLSFMRSKRADTDSAGSLSSALYGYSVPDCGTRFAGLPGSSAAQWAPSGNDWINSFDPTFLGYSPVQIVTIALGANDGNTVSGGQKVGECIGAVLTNHPRAAVFVATRTPQFDIGTGLEIPSDVINGEIAAQVASYRASGRNVVLVDQYGALTQSALTTDGLHPDYPGPGYPVMAALWASHILPWVNP